MDNKRKQVENGEGQDGTSSQGVSIKGKGGASETRKEFWLKNWRK